MTYEKFINVPANRVMLVEEFFGGKYDRETIHNKLHNDTKVNGIDVRECVIELASEYNSIQNKNKSNIEMWYSTTDNYIFDLLPWNSCNMFKNKVKYAGNIMNSFGVKKMADFGAGLGSSSILFYECFGIEDITYVDLIPSVTSNFAEFIFDKFKFDNIDVENSDDFLNSNEKFDCIYAGDVFEHIVDLEDVIGKILNKTNIMIHNSVFTADVNSPQHIQTISDEYFSNICQQHGFNQVKQSVFVRVVEQ